MDNLGTICLFGLVLLVALFILPRLMRGFGAPDYSQRGDEQSQYDDPNIRSRGGFGGGWGGFGRRRREYDDPDIDSRGSFGGRGSGGNPGPLSGGGTSGSRSGGGFFGSGRRSGSSGRRADDPNIRSRGSFGGRK
jgi:hypothetical protein